MANKRNLECMDSVICSKMPRLENKPSELSVEISKPTPFPTYAQENSLKYTGSYLAYHLRNRDGTDNSGIWSPSRAYLQSMSNLSAQSRATDDAHLGNRLYRTEPEVPSPTYQRSANEKDKLDLVKDLMNVRSKWVTFVERQKNLRNAQTPSGIHCPSPAGKHTLMASTLPTVHNCGNVAFPQPVYRGSICCSGSGCPLENSADHFHRRTRETEWRMTTPVTSSCLIANNDQLMHTQQYGNPLLKNKSLPHGHSNAQPSSTDRISKETGSLAGLQSPLCQGYGAYSRNVLQDPRYSMLQYGTMPSQASIHSLHNFQKPPLHPYSTSERQQLQPPFYCEKLSPPKYPMPIQPKVVHSQNTILNQQNAGPYSLLHPHGYRAQTSGCPYPSIQGTGGRIPVTTSTFVGQICSGNIYQQHSEYPVHSPPVPKGIPLKGPLIQPGLESGTQPRQLDLHSPSRKSAPLSHHDPANGKLPSSDILLFRPRVIVEAQTDKRCYDSLNSLPNKEYIGQHQLISKHSAFQPVLSGKHLKGAFERPAAVSPADQRPKDIYMHERHPSIDGSPISNHGISTFSKENEIVNKLVDSGQGDSPKSYNISPNRRILELNFQSPTSSREDKRLSAPSPPMPVINNVFSLAPYRSYLEATGLFFSRCQKCLSDSNKSLHCSCPSEKKTKHFGYAGVVNPDLLKQTPVQLSMGTSELQCKDAELKQSSTGVISNEDLSGQHPRKAENEKSSTDIQRQDVKLSPNLRILNVGRPSSSSSTASQEFDHSTGKLGEVTETDAELALDLSIKSKNQPVNVAPQQFSASRGSEEEWERAEEMQEEENVSAGESTSNTEGPKSKVDDTQLPLPSGSSESREELKSKEVSTEKQQNTAECEMKRKPEVEAQSDNNVQTVIKTPVISSAVTHSALTLELNKYKILRPVEGPNPTLPDSIDATKLSLLGSIDPLKLFLRPLKLIMPNEPKLAPSPVPEVRRSPCEIQPSVPSNGVLMPNENDSYDHFLSLHRSLCDMIAGSMAETSEEVLRACLQDIETQKHGQENPKLRSSLKSKTTTRNREGVKMSKSQEIWLAYGHVQPTMQKLLSQLETYHFTKNCPFPHVIRAGAFFIPIYLVKEKLFHSLKGAMIDQVFQEHKIELRPTTLSEEKKLQSELKLQRCSSRLIKLLSLKQLPEIYPDLLNVLWHSCAKLRLDLPSHVGLDAPLQVIKMRKR